MRRDPAMLASKSEFAEQVAAVVEVEWRKSTRSGPVSDNCVQLAPAGDVVAIRDSKNPGFGALVFDRDEMRAFVEGAKAGEFDDLI
jgi:hypothetical protein